MSERIARLYGPGTISANTASPTTLFTVDDRKTFIARGLHVVSYPSNGSSGLIAPSVLIGKTDLATGNILVGKVNTSPGSGGYIVGTEGVSIPFTEGEIAVAVVSNLARPLNSTATSFAYVVTGGAYFTETTTDATSLTSTGTPTLTGTYAPANVYFLIANAKASSADAVTSITDSHNPKVVNTGSIATNVVGTTTSVRTSIWGGDLSSVDTGSGSVVVNWGGTFTAAAWASVVVHPSAYFPGTPASSNIVLQSASNQGTTETTWGVTMTPTSGAKSFQLLIGCQQGGTSSSFSSLPTGAIQLDTFSQVTPNFTGGAWLIPEAQTNPSVTIGSMAGAGNWSLTCIEVAYGGYPTHLTLSGIIIE